MTESERGLAHAACVPTTESGECSVCFQPWPCDVAVAWENAHAAFCPRHRNGVDVCSTHLRPGDRYAHAALFTSPAKDGAQ